MNTKFAPEMIGALLCLSLGWLSGFSVNSADFTWFASLAKPSFNPPDWIFGPVWTVLYLMMGTALGKLWKHKPKPSVLLSLFVLQLIFNLLWSPLFFHFQRIDLALLDICALWLSLIAFMVAARKEGTIVLLFTPYVLWVSFALVLNVCIYQLNLSMA